MPCNDYWPFNGWFRFVLVMVVQQVFLHTYIWDGLLIQMSHYLRKHIQVKSWYCFIFVIGSLQLRSKRVPRSTTWLHLVYAELFWSLEGRVWVETNHSKLGWSVSTSQCECSRTYIFVKSTLEWLRQELVVLIWCQKRPWTHAHQVNEWTPWPSTYPWVTVVTAWYMLHVAYWVDP